MREAHETAVQKSLAAFNSSAVGVGPVRKKYEGLLEKFYRKAFEVRNVMNVNSMFSRNLYRQLDILFEVVQLGKKILMLEMVNSQYAFL